MHKKQSRALFCAFLAAVLYALNAPLSKLLLAKDAVGPAMLAGLLYVGAGLGMALTGFLQRKLGKNGREQKLEKSDLPYVIGMVVLDIAAPILLMLGLKNTSAAAASLLNNFEIVATSLIALFLFKEAISGRLWLAIALVTFSSVLLSIEKGAALSFSPGSLLVISACICWGFENNFTRRLSGKDPLEIVVVKGFGSGIGALIVACFAGEAFPAPLPLLLSLILGFVAYGLSIFFYIHAQRTLGAAKTSAYYAFAPFIGALLSLILFSRPPAFLFWIALPIMLLGAYLAARE